jgi:hypothetical protein
MARPSCMRKKNKFIIIWLCVYQLVETGDAGIIHAIYFIMDSEKSVTVPTPSNGASAYVFCFLSSFPLLPLPPTTGSIWVLPVISAL